MFYIRSTITAIALFALAVSLTWTVAKADYASEQQYKFSEVYREVFGKDLDFYYGVTPEGIPMWVYRFDDSASCDHAKYTVSTSFRPHNAPGSGLGAAGFIAFDRNNGETELFESFSNVWHESNLSNIEKYTKSKQVNLQQLLAIDSIRYSLQRAVVSAANDNLEKTREYLVRAHEHCIELFKAELSKKKPKKRK